MKQEITLEQYDELEPEDRKRFMDWYNKHGYECRMTIVNGVITGFESGWGITLGQLIHWALECAASEDSFVDERPDLLFGGGPVSILYDKGYGEIIDGIWGRVLTSTSNFSNKL